MSAEREQAFIDAVLARVPGAPTPQGAGDDAAVLAASERERVVTTDAMVEGVHFLRAHPPRWLGHKLLAVNLSDVAAMGAVPEAFVMTAALPRSVPSPWWEALAQGLGEAARDAGVVLVGGDIVGSPGPVMLSLTAWGRLGPAGPLTRSGGRPGDGLWVHGAVGRSAVGLARWLATPHPAGWAAPGAAEPADPCLRAHLRPAPDLRAGPAALAAGASAGMDLSDGLAVDLERLARASRVSLVVDLARLPADEALVDVPADVRVAGGEDYGLVVLAPEGAAAALAAAGFVAMGRAEAPAGPLVRFTEGDQAVTLAGVPFDHFGVGAGGP